MPSYKESIGAIEKAIKTWEQGLKYSQRRQKNRALNKILRSSVCALCELIPIGCNGCIVVEFVGKRCARTDEYIKVRRSRVSYAESSKDVERMIVRILSRLRDILEYAKEKAKNGQAFSSY